MKMNICVIIPAIFIAFSQMNGQTLRYASRFRNFSVESETGGIYLLDAKIYRDKNEHKFKCMLNITHDIRGKSIEVVVNRCVFEKIDCEYFQRWKFDHNLKNIFYMKNQIWTPMFENLTPKIDFPILKKNIYRTNSGGIDADAAVKFYPEALNYFWRVDAILNDNNGKKAIVLKLELSLFSYVERKKPN